MKIKATLDIGYVGAERKEEFEIDPEEIKGKNEDELENYIYKEYLNPWALENIGLGYEVIEN